MLVPGYYRKLGHNLFLPIQSSPVILSFYTVQFELLTAKLTWVSPVLPGKSKIRRYIGPRPLRPASFLIQYSLIIIAFDTFRLRVAGNGVRKPVRERDTSLLQNAYNSGTAAHPVSYSKGTWVLSRG